VAVGKEEGIDDGNDDGKMERTKDGIGVDVGEEEGIDDGPREVVGRGVLSCGTTLSCSSQSGRSRNGEYRVHPFPSVHAAAALNKKIQACALPMIIINPQK